MTEYCVGADLVPGTGLVPDLCRANVGLVPGLYRVPGDQRPAAYHWED